MNPSDFDEFTKRWDARTTVYWGDFRMFTDGTPLGYERKRGNTIMAGIGNSPCHYDVLGNLAAVYVGPLAEELNDLREPRINELLESDQC
ncbi:hypothetical protein GCM10011494_36790 [Novosphingobium endophyticum]|uniref:Uncharacterized protein n=2 Tax=Novosphingobium endophyticum TaxID=1955250 RepID=A0A916TW96_9SPHN|nr:hypothetical protein GCM10011494_36790 [Novosphingobium endophyticum]